MAQPVIMPRQGQSVESCILAKWHKQQGDAVAVGDLLFTYETDKATFDENAKTDGVLLAVLAAEGDDVPCLENVCVIGQPGEDLSAFTGGGAAPAAPVAPAVSNTSATQGIPGIPTVPSIPTTPTSGTKISPRARHLAARGGVDFAAATPTGPYGRIIARDIDALLASPERITTQRTDGVAMDATSTQSKTAETAPTGTTPQPESEYIRHSHIRKLIAKSMHTSIQSMAQLTMQASFDATDITQWRAQLKAKGEALGLPAVTLGDIVLFAVSRVLPKHRMLNAHYDDEGIRLFPYVNLGVAVDTERGLMVPTLFNANTMPLGRLSEEVRRLAKACRSGNANPDELSGGTFTVTNLGAMGVEAFTPVINPPQTAILGVCAIVERPRTVAGQIQTYPAMGLSLTIDHRAVDGAPAARFLADLVKYLEHFTLNVAF